MQKRKRRFLVPIVGHYPEDGCEIRSNDRQRRSSATCRSNTICLSQCEDRKNNGCVQADLSVRSRVEVREEFTPGDKCDEILQVGMTGRITL